MAYSDMKPDSSTNAFRDKVEQLISAREVCERLGVSSRTLLRAERRGDLQKGFKIGNQKYYEAEDVNTYLDIIKLRAREA